MAVKVASYVKNVGKSIVYSSIDVVKEDTSNISEFLEKSNELSKGAYAAIKNFKTKKNDNKQLNKVTSAVNVGIKNLIKSAKTGDFYNSAADDETSEAIFGDLLNLDDDFSFDFDSDSSGSTTSKSENQKSSMSHFADSMGNTIGAVATSNATAISQSTDIIVKSGRVSNKAIISQMEVMNASISANIGALYSQTNQLNEFAKGPLTTHLNNSKKYYDNMTKMMQEQTTMMKEFIETNRRIYGDGKNNKYNNKFNAVNSSMGYGGSINIEGYIKNIKKNFGDTMPGMILGMLGFGGEGGMGFGEDSNPLLALTSNLSRSGLKAIIKGVMGKKFKESLSNFDNSLSSLFSNFIVRMNKAQNDYSSNMVISELAKLFGIRVGKKDTINTANYNKNAVPFDGVTRKAIIEVIPGYLARIESALNGKGKNAEKYFDYDQGKWVNADSIKKNFEKEKANAARSANREIESDLYNFMQDIKSKNEKEYEEFQKFIATMSTKIFEDDGYFDPKIVDMKTRESTGDAWKRYGAKNKEQFDMALKHMSNRTISELAYKNMKAREDLNNRMQGFETDGSSIYNILFNENFDDIISDENLWKRYGAKNKKEFNKMLAYAASGKRLRGTTQKIGEEKNKYDMFISDPNVYDTVTGNSRDHTIESITKTGGVGILALSRDEQGKNIFYYLREILHKIGNAHIKVNEKSRKDKKVNTSYNAASSDNDSDDGASLFDESSSDPDSDEDRLYNLFDELKKEEEEKKKKEEDKQDPKETKKWVKEKFGETKLGQWIAKKTDADSNSLFKGPFKYMSELLDKADNAIFKMIFGENQFKDDEGNPIHSVFDYMVYKIKRSFEDLKNWMEEKIFNPLKKKFSSFFKDKATPAYEKYIKPTLDAAKGQVESGAKRAGDAVKNVAESVTGVAKTLKDGGVVSADDVIDAAGDIDGTITESAGGRLVTKRGLTMISPGEVILPATLNKKEQVKQLAAEKRDKIKITKALGNRLGNIAYNAEGSLSKEDLNRIIEEVKKTTKYKLPEIGAGGLLGGGAGLITGFNPILTAVIGSAISFINQNSAVKDILFGKMNEEGKRTGNGVVPKKVLQIFDKYGKDVFDFGITGGILGLISPFGIIGTAVIGASVGFLKNNESFKKFVFGDLEQGKDGLISNESLTKVKKAFKKHLPRMVAGAAAGAGIGLVVGGPFGILGNAALGAGASLLSTSNFFNELVFGDGTPENTGIAGAVKEGIIEPFKNKLTEIVNGLGDFIKKEMVSPFKNFVEAITQDIKNILTDVGDKIKDTIDSIIKSYISLPIRDFLLQKVFKPLNKFIGTIVKAPLKLAKGIITLPFKTMQGIADSRRASQIARGKAYDMSAQERLDFRHKNKHMEFKFGVMKGLKKDVGTKQDEYLATMSKEDLMTLSESAASNTKSKEELEKEYSDQSADIKNYLSAYFRQTDEDGTNIYDKISVKKSKEIYATAKSGDEKAFDRALKSSKLTPEQQEEIKKNLAGKFKTYKESKRKLDAANMSEKERDKKLSKILGHEVNGKKDQRNVKRAIDAEIKARLKNEAKANIELTDKDGKPINPDGTPKDPAQVASESSEKIKNVIESKSDELIEIMKKNNEYLKAIITGDDTVIKKEQKEAKEEAQAKKELFSEFFKTEDKSEPESESESKADAGKDEEKTQTKKKLNIEDIFKSRDDFIKKIEAKYPNKSPSKDEMTEEERQEFKLIGDNTRKPLEEYINMLDNSSDENNNADQVKAKKKKKKHRLPFFTKKKKKKRHPSVEQAIENIKNTLENEESSGDEDFDPMDLNRVNPLNASFSDEEKEEYKDVILKKQEKEEALMDEDSKEYREEEERKEKDREDDKEALDASKATSENMASIAEELTGSAVDAKGKKKKRSGRKPGILGCIGEGFGTLLRFLGIGGSIVGKAALGIGAVSLMGYASEWLKTKVWPGMKSLLFGTPNEDTGEFEGGLVPKVGDFLLGNEKTGEVGLFGKITNWISEKFTKIKDWFASKDGFSAFVSEKLIPWTINGIGLFAENIAGPLVNALVVSLPSVIKSAVKGAITGAWELITGKSTIKIGDGDSRIDPSNAADYNLTTNAEGNYVTEDGTEVQTNGFGRDKGITILGKVAKGSGRAFMQGLGSIGKSSTLLTKAANISVNGFKKMPTSKLGVIVSGASTAGRAITKYGAKALNASRNLGEKLNKKLFGKAVKEVTEEGAEAAVKTVAKKAAKEAAEEGTEAVAKTGFKAFFKKIGEGKIGSIIAKLAGKVNKKTVVKALEDAAEKLSKKAFGKLGVSALRGIANGIAKLNPVGLALLVKDFFSGFNNAYTIMGVAKSDDGYQIGVGTKVICGLLNVLTENITFGFIDPGDIVDVFIDTILPLFGVDNDELVEARNSADDELAKWNAEHPDEQYSNLKDFNNKDKWTTKVWKSIKNTWKKMWSVGEGKEDDDDELDSSGSGKSSVQKEIEKKKAKDKDLAGSGRHNYQKSKSIANIKYGDSTIGESGCAPVAASNVINRIKDGYSSVQDAASYAENKGMTVSGGGTDIGYFNSYFNSKGIPNYSTSNKKDVMSAINSGNQVVMLGKDSNNAKGAPFGSNPHFITAVGTDRHGNIIAEDPDMPQSTVSYKKSDVLGSMIRSVVIGKSKGNSRKSGSGRRYGRGGSNRRYAGRSRGLGPEGVINIAYSQLGTMATIDNQVIYNDVFYGYHAYGANYGWCCVFVWWCFNQAGAEHLLPIKTGGCANLMSAFASAGQLVSEPQAGDIAFMNFNGGSNAAHVGIVLGVTTDGKIMTIDGNTTVDSDNPPYGVAQKSRSKKYFVGFARPNFPYEYDDENIVDMTKYGDYTDYRSMALNMVDEAVEKEESISSVSVPETAASTGTTQVVQSNSNTANRGTTASGVPIMHTNISSYKVKSTAGEDTSSSSKYDYSSVGDIFSLFTQIGTNILKAWIGEDKYKALFGSENSTNSTDAEASGSNTADNEDAVTTEIPKYVTAKENTRKTGSAASTMSSSEFSNDKVQSLYNTYLENSTTSSSEGTDQIVDTATNNSSTNDTTINASTTTTNTSNSATSSISGSKATSVNSIDSTHTLTGSDNAKHIWNALSKKGVYTKAGLAGLMGNLEQESGYIPNNVENSYESKYGDDATYTQRVDDGTYSRDNFIGKPSDTTGHHFGYGLPGWTWWTFKQDLYDRTVGAQNKKSIGNLDAQIDYLHDSISTGFTDLYKTLTTTDDVNTAADAMLEHYERPEGFTPVSSKDMFTYVDSPDLNAKREREFTNRRANAQRVFSTYAGEGRSDNNINPVSMLNNIGSNITDTEPAEVYSNNASSNTVSNNISNSLNYTTFLETIVEVLLSIADNTAMLNKIISILSDNFDIKVDASDVSSARTEARSKAKQSLNELIQRSNNNNLHASNLLENNDTQAILAQMAMLARE